MVHEFTALAAWITLAGASVAGCFGLLMCRAMLLSLTASSLRREAVLSIMKQESFCSLNSHQQAAVFRALSESAPRQGASTLPGRSLGSPIPQIRLMSAPLDTSINRPQKEKHAIHQDS